MLAPSRLTRATVVCLAATGVFGPGAAFGHGPISTRLTWTKEISRLVFKRCAACHHEGGPAPMSLLTYAAARPWAKAIKEEVLERRMPPWNAVPGFGEFKDPLALSQEEMHLIADWVEGGAPEGEPQFLPDPPRPAPRAAEIPVPGLNVRGELRLRRTTRLRAVRPEQVDEHASLKAIAETPDGAVVPLLWLLDYRSKAQRNYHYAQPVTLPAGSVIRVFGPGSLVFARALVRGGAP